MTGIDDEPPDQTKPYESAIEDKKGSNLKLRAMIIIASAIFSYAVIILGLEYLSTHDPERWLISSAYYDPGLESFAVNYQDVQEHTAKVTVDLQTAEGDVLKLGEFAGSQQALLSSYASAPQSVTFTIQLNDGNIVTKTIDVQVITIIQDGDSAAIITTTEKA